MRGMKKLTSAAVAAALSASLLVAPTAVAADNGGSSSSSADSVTRDKDNADAIPDGYEVPEQPALGSAYTGSASLSIFLATAATAAILGVIAQYPPIQKELQKVNAQWMDIQRQAMNELQKFLPLPQQNPQQNQPKNQPQRQNQQQQAQ